MYVCDMYVCVFIYNYIYMLILLCYIVLCYTCSIILLYYIYVCIWTIYKTAMAGKHTEAQTK
jgi:predicted membrane protein